MLYKAKTLAQALTEIAGLIVLFKAISFLLSLFHEWKFNRLMKQQTQEGEEEDFREVFTYDNFKKNLHQVGDLERQILALEGRLANLEKSKKSE